MDYTFITATTTEDLVANVIGGVGDNIDAVLLVVGLAVAVPLVFYIGGLIRGLFPSARGRR